MSYERPYYEDLNYRPLLFYVIFGVEDKELNVSRKRHRVDVFPEGLDFTFYRRPENNAYMSTLIGGTLGEVLDRHDHDLYEKIKNTDHWAVIRGEVRQDADLNYMRNVTGFIQACIEAGAAGVLDLQTFTLFSSKEWTEKFFVQEFDPYAHIIIFASDMEDGSVWLHTRGMRKFGRPDVSMENVEKSKRNNAIQVINQILYYGALGAFFSKPTKLHTYDGETYIVKPDFIDDFDNLDFNNAYYQLSWKECELIE